MWDRAQHSTIAPTDLSLASMLPENLGRHTPLLPSWLLGLSELTPGSKHRPQSNLLQESLLKLQLNI